MKLFPACLAAFALATACALADPPAVSYPLWDLAKSQADAERVATLFTAQDVRDLLSTDDGIKQAIDWCKRTGVTHVFVEEFRDGYQAERAALVHVRDQFLAAGFMVSGCVTTTRVGKPSTGWGVEVCCYTDQPTQERLQSIFEYAAGLFDEIMIDDFYFTDCACDQCAAGWQSHTVKIGDKSYSIPDGLAATYRCELMLRMGEIRILAAAKRVNPKVKVILKYPQWYDDFQNRGYDVVRESAAFDRIWVGTELRDYEDRRWGGTAPYEGYFIMRWLGGIGGDKCGGGWYDYLGTSPQTYVEQARQTILAGARESFLFHYGGLRPGGSTDSVEGFSSMTGAADILAFRDNLPELLTVAGKVRGRGIAGVAAYKPPGSQPFEEGRVFDYVGMMGIPLAPCSQFPTNAPAAFFSVHALKDFALMTELSDYIKTGRPVLMTDGLAARVRDRIDTHAANVQILNVNGAPAGLLNLTQYEVDEARKPFLAAFRTTFLAPNRVALYLFDGGGWVVENFNSVPADIELNGKYFTVEARGWKYKL